jgi:hypothetical protein
MGSTNSANIGLKHAKGYYCSFMAGDDIPHHDMFSTMVYFLEKEDADLVYADMFIVDDIGRILRHYQLPDYSFKNTFCYWNFCGVAKLFKKELLQKYGFLDPKYKLSSDHELLLRFAMHGTKFYHIKKTLYSIRFHGPDRKIGLHTPQNELRMLKESAYLVKKARQFLYNQQCSKYR